MNRYRKGQDTLLAYKIIIGLVIFSFLCQNLVWARGSDQFRFFQKKENKLSAASKMTEIVDGWRVFSLILFVYEYYGMRSDRKQYKEIAELSRLKKILSRRSGIPGEMIANITQIFRGREGLIYVGYRMPDEQEVLLRIAAKGKDTNIVLAESSEIVPGRTLQVIPLSEEGALLGMSDIPQVGGKSTGQKIAIKDGELGRLWEKTFLYAIVFNLTIFLVISLSCDLNFTLFTCLAILVELTLGFIMAVISTYNLAASRLIWRDKAEDGWEKESKYYARTPLQLPVGVAWPSHTVMLPIYNEDWSIIKKTLAAALVAVDRYNQVANGGKANIIVCDDGLMAFANDDPDGWLAEVKEKQGRGEKLTAAEINYLSRIEYCRQDGIGYVARPRHQPGVYERKGLFKKASNLNHAHRIVDIVERSRVQGLSWEEAIGEVKGRAEFSRTYIKGAIQIGDIITMLDNDSTMPPDGIVKTVSEFVLDPDLGYTQNTTSVTNAVENYFTKLIAESTDVAWRFLHALSARYGFVRFGGHNGMLRKELLQRINYWPEEMVAEDTWMSMRIAGLKNETTGKLYYGKFVDYPTEQFGEELPNAVSGYKKMINKFAFGVTQLTFNPIRDWFKKGLLTADIKLFMLNQGIPVRAKIDMIVHLLKYYIVLPVILGNILTPLILLSKAFAPAVLNIVFWGNLFAFICYASLIFVCQYREKKDNGRQLSVKGTLLRTVDYVKSTATFLSVFPEMVMGITMRLLNINKIFNPTPKGKNGEMSLGYLFSQIFKNNLVGIISGSVFFVLTAVLIVLGYMKLIHLGYIIFPVFVSASWILVPFLFEPDFMRKLKKKFIWMRGYSLGVNYFEREGMLQQTMADFYRNVLAEGLRDWINSRVFLGRRRELLTEPFLPQERIAETAGFLARQSHGIDTSI